MNIVATALGALIFIAGMFFVIMPTGKIVGKDDQKSNKRPIWAFLLLPVGIGVLLLGNSLTIVPTGYTGVRITMGQVSDEVLGQGVIMKAPFISEIRLVQNKQQDKVIEEEVWGESIEKTPVYAAGTVVTYKIAAENSSWILANVAGGADGLITSDIVASAVKSAMVELPAANVTNRSYIEPLTKTKLSEALKEKYGDAVTVLKVVINDMDFEPEYNAAIAAKSNAQMEYEAQQIRNQTTVAAAEANKTVSITNAEAAKQATIAAAEGEAQALLVKAEAEAEANKLLAQSLTDMILKDKYYEKWDGKLPTTILGDDNAFLIGLDSSAASAEQSAPQPSTTETMDD